MPLSSIKHSTQTSSRKNLQISIFEKLRESLTQLLLLTGMFQTRCPLKSPLWSHKCVITKSWTCRNRVFVTSENCSFQGVTQGKPYPSLPTAHSISKAIYQGETHTQCAWACAHTCCPKGILDKGIFQDLLGCALVKVKGESQASIPEKAQFSLGKARRLPANASR